IFPQDSTLSQPELNNYIQFLDKEVGKPKKEVLKSLSLDKIKKIASLRYQAYDKDFFNASKYLLKSRKESGIIGIIREKMGNKVATLLWVNYLLKYKINSVNLVQHYSSAADFTYPRYEINATILDVIKGINKFKPGDTLMFSYIPGDYVPYVDFHKGETVFSGFLTGEYRNVISITLFYENPRGGSDASYGRYPIGNGILIDANNAWGYGKSVPWEEFKRRLTQDINNIILGR
ncbi:MAG: hypothetical protein P4L27_03655, partial [Ignavibacteriaceae bacterium]|nr:hypothetical protein [Ignavibacteriaceae bacterium]